MTQERVMLLIDADNVSVDVMEQAVRLLMNQHGAVHVRRAYCTAESAVKHQAVFKRLSIKPMVNLSAGKNSTDIALAVDAVDLVLAERPDVVVIASSDSDFAPLVARLREKGCVVRGIGQEGKTGDETQDAYDDFTVLAHRKASGGSAARASGGASAASPRGGASTRGRTAGAGRSAAAPQKSPAAQPDKAGQGAPASGRGSRSGRAGRASQTAQTDQTVQNFRKAPAPTPSAADQAEDEAAAEATLAALRTATQRAAEQQAAAAAAQAEAAEQMTASVAEVDGGSDSAGDDVALAPPPAAKKAARKTPARKAAARKPAAAEAGAAPKPARKTATRKTAAARLAAPAEVVVAALPVAEAEQLAAQIAATLAPPAAPTRAAQPAPAPRDARPSPSSAAVAALPDKVLKILASLPELARGDTVELRLASQRMRDAGLLGKSASSAKLLGQFADRFELLPPGQPNHVRLRGGKLV